MVNLILVNIGIAIIVAGYVHWLEISKSIQLHMEGDVFSLALRNKLRRFKKFGSVSQRDELGIRRTSTFYKKVFSHFFFSLSFLFYIPLINSDFIIYFGNHNYFIGKIFSTLYCPSRKSNFLAGNNNVKLRVKHVSPVSYTNITKKNDNYCDFFCG